MTFMVQLHTDLWVSSVRAGELIVRREISDHVFGPVGAEHLRRAFLLSGIEFEGMTLFTRLRPGVCSDKPRRFGRCALGSGVVGSFVFRRAGHVAQPLQLFVRPILQWAGSGGGKTKIGSRLPRSSKRQ